MLPHQIESSSDFSCDQGSKPFFQIELNDLVRDLGLSKDEAELLDSRLENKNLLSPETFGMDIVEGRNFYSFYKTIVQCALKVYESSRM